MPIFTKLFAIKIVANNFRGCSNNTIIALADDLYFFRSSDNSFVVKEKNATSAPATNALKMSKKKTMA